MTTRVDVERLADTLRALAERLEAAEHDEELVEIADEAITAAARIRAVR